MHGINIYLGIDPRAGKCLSHLPGFCPVMYVMMNNVSQYTPNKINGLVLLCTAAAVSRFFTLTSTANYSAIPS